MTREVYGTGDSGYLVDKPKNVRPINPASNTEMKEREKIAEAGRFAVKRTTIGGKGGTMPTSGGVIGYRFPRALAKSRITLPKIGGKP